MPRQQRDFTGDHAEFWPARTARRGLLGIVDGSARGGRRGQPRQDVVGRSAKIYFHDLAGVLLEHKDRGMLAPVEHLLGRAGNVSEIARRDAAVSFEGNIGGIGHRLLL